MKKKRWLCLLTAMLISWLLSLSASAAHNPNKGTYQGTVDQIYLAIHDQEGEWPAEPSIADHKYLFLVKSENGIQSGGSGSVPFDTKASTYISTTAFQNLYRSSVKTSGSSGGRVTGLSKPAGMDGTEGFWAKDGFQTLTDLKSEIIRVYLQNRTSGTEIKNPTAAQIAEYDVLIYVVKYEEYYNPDGSVTMSNSGYHVDCAVVKKSNVKITYDANLPDGYSIADGVGLPNNKTVSRNTGETALDSLSYSSEALRGEEIQNSAGQTGRFLGWSLTANGTDADLVTSINIGTADVTVYAIWSIEEEEPEEPLGSGSVKKRVKSVGGTDVTQNENGQTVIPTAYPGYEIVWEITVTNHTSKTASFTLTDALLEKGASVYNENSEPAIVSGTLWTTDMIPAGGSSRYTVRYTLTEEDLSASGLINTVILDEEKISAEAVQTKAYPVYVYFRTLLVSENGSAQAAAISGVNYNDSSDGSWATLGWITDILTQQPADQYSETSYESGLQVAKSAVNGNQFTAYGGNESWLSSVQWDELIAAHGANGLGETEIVTEPEGRLAWHLNGSVHLCELTYNGNADEVSNVPESAYLVQNTESQISDQTPYRAGYVFTGWNTEPDGTGAAYTAGDTITLAASDTLYAQWTETTASFDLNDMGGSPVIKKHLDGDPSASYQETFRVTVTQLPMQRPLALDSEETADAGSTMTGYASISADTRTAGFLFEEEQHILTFNAAGTYLYQIQEVAGSHSRVTYDDTVYQLQITVKQTDDGTLRIKDWQFLLAGKESLGAYLTITNTYTAASGGGGGGGTSKPILVKPTVKEYLNTEDHFAYLVGYSDGTIRPNGSITRAEVATIFFRLLNDDVREENLTRSNSFTDVSRGDWYNTAVSTMASLGILDGYSDGTFRPNEPITRAEFAAIAARFDESALSGIASFSDLSGHWAAEEIGRAYQNGWVTGYSDGTFRPDQSITRAEAVTLINRVLERELPDDAELLDDMNVWSDNRDSKKWYYLDMQEASNSHAYTRDKKDVESWVKLRTDPDWTSYED